MFKRKWWWLALATLTVLLTLELRRRTVGDPILPAFPVAQSGPFQPPDRAARRAALGDTSRINRDIRAAYANDDDFEPIPSPGPSDWLAQHSEPGQTFAQFVKSRPNRPDKRRQIIYLQPIGDFSESSGPSLEKLQDFANRFFDMKVVVNEPTSIADSEIPSRIHRGGQTQLLSTGVLTWLKDRVPNDAYCLLAVTMTDLYPAEDWNFVFGQASLRDRVGVYSFARYDPHFYGNKRGKDTDSLILLRSCKVLAHETGHMFGIRHCVHYHCLMNGSNHLDETDAHPVHLCPVCLRKLDWSKSRDLQARYQGLKEFADQSGWESESKWLETRLKRFPK